MYPLLNVIAAAGDGAEPSLLDPNLLANLTGIVVFLVALAVLWIFVWPKIVKGLDDRNEKILSEIKSAEDARAQAKSALADYERELATAREEASQMINDARAQAKQLAEELREKNEKELADRMARANADIEAAKSEAVADLHGQAATLATLIAGKILDREITSGDNQKLVEESLAELGNRN